MTPSPSVRRFRARLLFGRWLRAIRFDAGDILTVAALVFLGVGLAWVTTSPGWAFLTTGCLLIWLTPIGAAIRILLRGK